jgi:uncharacterized protein (DUF488 family)
MSASQDNSQPAEPMVRRPLLTVGHSNHDWPRFVDLIRAHGVTAIADVRSSPFSRFVPWFNREALERGLRGEGIAYAFLGRELGARREEPECYLDDGRVSYERVRSTMLFRQGVRRVLDGAARHRIALLCAEQDPITCHRMVLVCRALADEPIEIAHIRESGRLESQDEAEERLLAEHDLAEERFFEPRAVRLAEAYRRQGAAIAWTDAERARSADAQSRAPA